MNKEIITKELSKNECTFAFAAKEEADFMAFLMFMESEDLWVDVDLSNIRLELMPEPSSCKIGIRINAELFPLLDDAYYSVKRRAKNNAEILKQMSNEDFVAVLNYSWAYFKDKDEKQRIAYALIRGGNVLALHSNRYSTISQKQIYLTFKMHLAKHYEDVSFLFSTYRHNITEGVYRIYDSTLIDGYTKLLNKKGVGITKDDVRVAVALRTSDTGLSSISLNPIISIRGSLFVPFYAPLRLEHKNNADMDAVKDQYVKIFSIVESGMENLERLAKIDLINPSCAAIRLSKRFMIPKKAVKELSPRFAFYEDSGSPMSAHDFYFTMCEVLSMSKYSMLTLERQLAVQDALSKIPLLSDAEWEKVDAAGAKW